MEEAIPPHIFFLSGENIVEIPIYKQEKF